MRVHLLSPGISSSRTSGGGTTLFRGLAQILATSAPVLAYEPACATRYWTHEHVTPVQHRHPSDAVDDVTDGLRTGDVVVKVAGALPGRWDMECDLRLARLRRMLGIRFCYVDCDAPSRLPILQYLDGYLHAVLPKTDAVIVSGGGPRAAHGYRAMTGAPVMSCTSAFSWYGVTTPTSPGPVEPHWDVAAIFGVEASRDVRVRQLIHAFTDRGLTVAWMGRSQPPDTRNLHRLGYVDGPDLADVISRSRFTMSLLRGDVAGFTETHPCRLIEAARLGSLVISEPFPGIERLLVPGRECIPILDQPDDTVTAMMRCVGERRHVMTNRARAHVASIADDERERLLQTLLS